MNAPKRILICLGAILVLAGSTYVKVQATKKLSGKTVQIGKKITMQVNDQAIQQQKEPLSHSDI